MINKGQLFIMLGVKYEPNKSKHYSKLVLTKFFSAG